MPRTSTAVQEARADAVRIRFELGREIRTARLDAGTSLRRAAARAGISHTQLRRIELGLVDRLTVEQASISCGAVGLRLHARAVPGSGAALDAGQLALIGRLRNRLPAAMPSPLRYPFRCPAIDVPGMPSSARSPEETPVEAETRLRDVQALDRRSLLKLRDSPYERMILLGSDTPHNRQVLEVHRAALRTSFPLDTRAVLVELGRGHAPKASGLVLL